MERYICTKPQSSFIPCGAIVCAKKKHSHHTLVEYNDAEYYVSNDNIDPFFDIGEVVLVRNGDSFITGQFIHHSGPGFGLVMVDGIVDDRRLIDVQRCNI